MKQHEVRLIPVPLRDEIRPGDDLAEKLQLALSAERISIEDGDVLVIKHKIVSKSEGQIVPLQTVKPDKAARSWARTCSGDARVIQLALSQSKQVIRKKVIANRGVLITETRHGFICANSGVDLSNVDGGDHAVLLPKDPDKSAARIRSGIKKKLGIDAAVVISDSFGRAWREGLTEVAIGVSGIKPLRDYRGTRDAHGYVLQASAEAIADELACAAGLVCGKLNRTPVCIVRGFRFEKGLGKARELIRPKENDLFR